MSGSLPLGGSQSAPRVAIDSRGNVLVASTVFDPSTFVRDYSTIKFSAIGQRLWSHRFNGTGNRDDILAAIAINPADEAIVTVRRGATTSRSGVPPTTS